MADEKIVSDERLHDYLRAYCARTVGLTAPRFRITEGTSEGDNYTSLVCRVAIEAAGEDGGEAKGIQLILKTRRPRTCDVPSSGRDTRMFQREVFFYREVLPVFEETLKGRGGLADRFPVLHDVDDESGNEILLLENLAPQGFVMAQSKILDYPHLSLALRCLGEFHACSFVTRAANPTGFEKLKRMDEPLFLEESIVNTSDTNKKLLEYLVGVVLKALVNEDKHYSERYQRFIDNIAQSFVDVTDGRAAEPYAVVNHGDFWTNNMLFKYDQEKGPCDLRFIDLQLCRYASPVLDLVYIFFCCCTQETRSKYYDQMIHDDYYGTLSKCIERAGYDPKVLFPYEVLSQHLTKFGKYAAGMATYTLHIFTNNGVKTTNDNNMLQEKVQNDSFYRNMIIGTFKDLVDKNYI